MVLLGLISGRRMGTRLLAFSCVRRKIWVWIWPPPRTAPADTAPPCSLASPSGSTSTMPAFSTSAKPCVRSWAPNRRSASAGETGVVLVSVSVPRTRGSTTTLRPVSVAMVRATASISALAKSSVTLPPLAAGAPAAGCARHGASGSAPASASSRAGSLRGRRAPDGKGRRDRRGMGGVGEKAICTVANGGCDAGAAVSRRTSGRARPGGGPAG